MILTAATQTVVVSQQIQQLQPLADLQLSQNAQVLQAKAKAYSVGSHNPLPSFIVRGQGAKLWDINGKEYIDFVGMFGSANQGHCHPRLVEALQKQLAEAYIVNLSMYPAAWPNFAEMMCRRFGYDKIAAATTGSEITDLACKIARKWGHVRKGIPVQDVLILGIGGSYHGLNSGVWNLTNPSKTRSMYGMDNVLQTNVNPSTGEVLRYGNVNDLEDCFAQHHERIAALILEPIRGHLQTFEEEIRYGKAVSRLCKEYNILFIADEVRMGCGKSGKFLSSDWLGVENRPDMICLGKSITGGAYPASFVLGTTDCMSVLGFYESASTFAYTPMATTAVITALQILDDEKLPERALVIGARFEAQVNSWNHPIVKNVYVRGADVNIELAEDHPSGRVSPRRVCALLMHKGVMTTPRAHKVRMGPPLVISDQELDFAIEMIKEALDEVLLYEDIPGGYEDSDRYELF